MKFYEVIEGPTPQALADAVREFLGKQHTLNWVPCGGPTVWPRSKAGYEVWVQALYCQ